MPTVVVVSDAFKGNATIMAKLAGIPDYPFIAVPHPVSTLDQGEIEEMVKNWFPQVLELLMARPKVEAR